MTHYLPYSALAILLGISSLPIGLELNALLSILAIFSFCSFYKKNPLNYKSAFLFGFILTLTQFYWIGEVFKLFTNSSIIPSIGFSLLMYSYAALQFMLLVLFGALIRKIKNFPDLLILPLSWTLVEIIFPKFVPWSQGATIIALTPFIKIADLGGVYLVTFLLFLTCSLCVEILISVRRREKVTPNNLMKLALIFLLPISYSYFKRQQISFLEKEGKKISIAFIQPNLNPATDFTFENLPNRIALTRDLTTKALSSISENPDLIIWPESSVGYTYYPEETYISQTDERHPFPNLKAPLLFGGQVQIGKVYKEDTKFYNAALLLLPNGELKQDYYKELLFPFSEETPLGSILPPLKQILSPLENYEKAGEDNKQSIKLGSNIIAVRICFEDIWPSLFRENIVRDGAELLVSISNDGWFAKSAAMHQHHMLSIWRAIENDRYFLRIGNNGITDLISPMGKIITSYKSNEQLSGVFKEVILLKETSFYTEYGLLATLIWISITSALFLKL